MKKDKDLLLVAFQGRGLRFEPEEMTGERQDVGAAEGTGWVRCGASVIR